MPTILIIEDTDEMRTLIRDFIARLNYDVYEAADGLEGIKMAKAVAPDLIILDLMMPVASGDLALGFIRSTDNLKKVPVIVTSAHPNAYNISQQLGADACLLKPFKFDELKDLVTRLVPV